MNVSPVHRPLLQLNLSSQLERPSRVSTNSALGSKAVSQNSLLARRTRSKRRRLLQLPRRAHLHQVVLLDRFHTLAPFRLLLQVQYPGSLPLLTLALPPVNLVCRMIRGVLHQRCIKARGVMDTTLLTRHLHQCHMTENLRRMSVRDLGIALGLEVKSNHPAQKLIYLFLMMKVDS